MSGQLHASAVLLVRKKTVTIEQETGWAPEAVWTILRTEKSLVPAGLQTPNRPARSTGFCWLTVSRVTLEVSRSETLVLRVKIHLKFEYTRILETRVVYMYRHLLLNFCEFSTTELVCHIKVHEVSKFLPTNNKQYLVADILGLRRAVILSQLQMRCPCLIVSVCTLQ